MQEYELNPIIDGLQYIDRPGWEQARAQMFSIASMFAKKGSNLTPQDMLRFPWEQEEKADTTMSNEDKDRLAKEAQQFAHWVTHGGMKSENIDMEQELK